MRPFPLLAIALLFQACGQSIDLSDGGEALVVNTGANDGGPMSVPDSGPGGVDVDPGVSIGPVEIEQWCDALAKAVCDRDFRCLRLGSGQMPQCLARTRETCDQAAYSDAVRQGRIEYSAEQAGRCLGGYGYGSCEDKPQTCEALFKGTVPANGDCFLAEECVAPTSFCHVYGNTCPFKCLAYVAKGATCNGFDKACVPGEATCQSANGGGRTCATPRGEGEPCTGTECGPGMLCYANACTVRLAKTGDACGVNGPFPLCGAEDFCRSDANQPMGGLAGTCQRRPGLGGLCVGYDVCLPNLHCSNVYETGTCVGRGELGAQCNGYDDCQNELFCSTHSSTCQPLPTAGSPCDSFVSLNECAVGHFCDYNSPNGEYVCDAERTVGSDCRYDDECQSNSCEYEALPDAGFGGRCTSRCSVGWDGGL